MKFAHISFLFLVVILLSFFVPFAEAGSWIEQWVSDPKTGVKICVLFSSKDMKLESASWSGKALNGLADGRGNLTYTYYASENGQLITAAADAEMKGGKLHGHVSIKWSVNESYEGEYQNGIRNGRGLMRFSNGTVYDGEWKDNKIEGRGILKGPDGGVYEGEFKDNKKEGRGVYKYPSGQVAYDGMWKDDKINGYGIMHYNGGAIYEGEFKDNRREGRGVYKDPFGNVVYDGLWKDDKPADSTMAKINSAKVDKVLDIPWGATEDETKKIMKARPGTKYQGTMKTDKTVMHNYSGPFSGDQTLIVVYFYRGKMFSVGVFNFLTEDQLFTKFNEWKAGMTERYGPPKRESGKYLDSKVWWDLDSNHEAGLSIVKNPYSQPADGGTQAQPFAVVLCYWQTDINSIVFPPSEGKKDF